LSGGGELLNWSFWGRVEWRRGAPELEFLGES
jgi:hypothetical protein